MITACQSLLNTGCNDTECRSYCQSVRQTGRNSQYCSRCLAVEERQEEERQGGCSQIGQAIGHEPVTHRAHSEQASQREASPYQVQTEAGKAQKKHTAFHPGHLFRTGNNCHTKGEAGCMRQARSSHSSRNFESKTHKRRKLAVNRGRRRFFESIRCLQAASWLSTASSLAASTALEQRIARRKVRPYRNASQAQTRRLQRFVRRFFVAFMPLR